MTRRILASTVLLAAAVACTAEPAAPARPTTQGQPATPAQPATPTALDAPEQLSSLGADDLDAFIKKVIEKQHGVGVTVGVMQNGKVIFNRGFGLANTNTRAPVTPETLFAIGSVSKQFTCAIVLKLQEAGKLSFSDKLAKYDKHVARAGDITIRDLGNHVAGYRDYYPLDFVGRPMAQARPSDDIIKEFTERPLDFEPGTRYSYSNTGYLLLGRVAELVSGKPFATLLTEHLISPLGLTHTRYEPKRGDPGLAEGYMPVGLEQHEPAIPEGEGWIGAAGGLWSTPADLMTWDLALMDGKVLSPATLQEMISPRRLSDGRSSAYGCGLTIRDRAPTLVLQHGGGVSGFAARNAFVPSTRSAVVVIANTDWAGSMLDTIQEAILSKLIAETSAPKVDGLPAKDVTLALLDQMRAGMVDRSQLGEEFNVFLTPERLAVMSKSLVDAGEVSQVEAGPISERGGLEVSTVRLMLGTTPVRTLMYRSPNGKIEEFLFNHR